MDFNLNGILIFNLNETTPSPYSKEIKNRDNVKFKTVNTLQACLELNIYIGKLFSSHRVK